jgi:hypothetical protein
VFLQFYGKQNNELGSCGAISQLTWDKMPFIFVACSLPAFGHIDLGQQESLPHRPAVGRTEPAPSQELVRTALIPDNPI